ncbi:MAG: pentapeptide repeat-containing protein, partial [Deltaproteobacteria bacterium]|nr:pentapeptide repeat-containing protein [Deltaproteobacteria bacterium]
RAMPTPADERPSSVTELPRMNATFPMTMLGDLGLCMGEAWWMDSAEVCFWAPEPLPSGREMPGRVDFRRGTIADLGLRLVDTEPPAKHRGGFVFIARWTTRAAGDAAKVVEALKAANPVAFLPGYRPPRLPAGTAAWNGVERRAGVAEITAQKAKLAEDLAASQDALARARARRKWWLATGLALGTAAGAALGIVAGDGFAFRLWLYEQDPTWAQQGLLAGARLRGADLASTELPGIDFRGADLRGANLQGADLRSAQFAGAQLDGADLRGANLAAADFDGASIDRARFDGADLRSTQLDGATGAADFRLALSDVATAWSSEGMPAGTLGPGARCAGLDLRGVDARGVDLRGGQLDGALLEGARLERASLQKASLLDVLAPRANFSKAQLDGAKLRLQAEAAVFTGVDLQAAVLDGSALGHADFIDANLVGASLVGVVATGAVFTRANLEGANLTGAQLVGADLSRSNLVAAQLCGADLAGARLDNAMIERVSSCDTTRWPEGFTPPGVVPVLASAGD